MKLYRLEIAILITISIIFTYAAAVSINQDNMANGLLRLHVLASSNSTHDQEVKLIVRDAVLDFCKPLLENAKDREQVEYILNENMQELANVAQKTLWELGEDKSVKVSLKEEYYPTRDYDTFSLPAGKYLGLRVVIGEGNGRNWWCVVFPPMCNEVSQGKNTEEPEISGKYTVKFKTAEIIGNIRGMIFG